MTTFLPKLHTILSFVGRVAGFSASGFFSGSPSPGPLGVPLGPSWTFSGVCGDIRGSGCAAGVGGAGGGFAAGVGCTGGVFATGVLVAFLQILPLLQLVLLMPAAGLPLVPVMPVAGLPPVLAVSVAGSRWSRSRQCWRHCWQIIGTISGYRHLKVNLKEKM